MNPEHDPYYYDNDGTLCPICSEKLSELHGAVYCDFCDWSSDMTEEEGARLLYERSK